MRDHKRIDGFTIMEILVVVIIIGVIASFALPRYGKSVAQSHYQDMVMQLSAIRTANQIYFAQTSMYWPHPTYVGDLQITGINSNLGLNIIENNVTYNCTPTGVATTFSCTGVYQGGDPPATSFTVEVTQAPLSTDQSSPSALNPKCISGACP